MYEAHFPMVLAIDRMLREQNHGALQSIVDAEVDKGLLHEDALNAARLLRLPACVIFLSTLAVENLKQAHRQRAWLAIYQSQGRGAPTEAFQALPAKLPLKVVGAAVLARSEVDAKALHKAHGGMDEWFRVTELCMDHWRFDLLETVIRELVLRKIDTEDWLRLAKLMINRHTHVSRAMDADALGRSYLRIRDNLLVRLASVVTARSRLALFATHSFFHSGSFAAAIEAAKLATTPEDQIHAAFDIARSWCFLGDLDQSLVWLDRLIELMSQSPLIAPPEAPLPATQDDEPEPEKDKRKKFDPEQASGALVDLQNALELIGKKAFLVSGTLLGYHREGGLLAHDKDIDVGIIGWEDQYAVVNALLQSGHFGVDSRRLRAEKTYHIPLKHIDTQVSIDIFVYHEEGGKLVTGVESYFGYLQKFAFTPFGLQKVHFLGIDFYVPDDIETNLAENFGEWRVSDPEYISHLQSPSTVDVGGKVFQIVGRIRALEAMRAGKYEKLGRVIRIMTEQQQRPGGMSDHTLDLLRTVYQQRPVAEVAHV